MISVCGVMGYTPLQQPRAARLASPATASMAPAAWFPVTSARAIVRSVQIASVNRTPRGQAAAHSPQPLQ